MIDRFEVLLNAVLEGRIPEVLHGDIDVSVIHEAAVTAWRDSNLENIALIAENVSIARQHIDILDTQDLWDVCCDVRWLEGHLIEELRSQ
jgi:hypothetical protein